MRLFARPRAEERAFARNLVLWFLVASPLLWMVGRFARWLIGGHEVVGSLPAAPLLAWPRELPKA